MRKIQLLGITLQDYSVKEAMKRVDQFLSDGKVSAITFVTTDGLMKAQKDELLRDFLSKVDLTIAADVDILKAANIQTKNRMREIENNDFLIEFLKKLVRAKSTIVLLTDTNEKLLELEKHLLEYQSGLRIVAGMSLDQMAADDDALINQINMLAPNILISEIESMKREEIFEKGRLMLNTEVWLMIKSGMPLVKRRENVFRRISQRIFKNTFRKKVLQYNNSNQTKKGSGK